jgi:predicted enzyme related to lactoylglutathione lyase
MTKRPVVHIEIPSNNSERSAKFYNEVFGWETEHTAEPVPYTVFEAGNTGGGFPEVGEMYSPGDVLIYVASDDLEADLKKIESLGGSTVVPQMAVEGHGTLAIFTDPTGNKVALWKSNNPE